MSTTTTGTGQHLPTVPLAAGRPVIHKQEGLPMDYRRMSAVAVVVYLTGSALLGFVASATELTRDATLLIGGIYFTGGLPGVLYLHVVATTQQARAEGTGPSGG